MTKDRALWIGILLACAFVPSARAQTVVRTTTDEVARLRFEGIRIEPGIASPEHADAAFQIGGAAALGTIFRPWLRLTTGVGVWSADIDRSALGSDATGTVSDFVVSADLRWDPVRVWRLRPYVLAGIAGHAVGADVPSDPSLEDALSGFELGADLGFGVRTNRNGLSGTLEARRRFVDTVDNWTYQLGVGYTFAGKPRYRRPTVAAPAAHTVVVPEVRAPSPVPAPVQIAQPVTRAPSTESLDRLAQTLRALAAENRALRSDLDSLRRAATAPVPATLAPSPAVPVPAVPPPDPTPAIARAALGDALGRIPLVREHPEAVVELRNGYRLALSSTFAFEPGGTMLSVEAREALRQIGLVMFRHRNVAARIEGHADASGRPAANEKISLDRAAVVRDELVRLGISSDRLDAIGIGSARPVADNGTPEGRAKNRRVEITLEVQS